MLIQTEVFLLAAFGCLATNIDNILLVLSSGGRLKAMQCASVLLAVLSVAILLGFALSLGLDIAIPRYIAWVGLIPLTMGVYELTPWPRDSQDSEKATAPGVTLLALALPLAANSFDTLIVQTVLFSDFASDYHTAALAGSFAAALALAALSFAIISRPAVAKYVLPLAARFRPWLLIIVGALILMDTGFDGP